MGRCLWREATRGLLFLKGMGYNKNEDDNSNKLFKGGDGADIGVVRKQFCPEITRRRNADGSAQHSTAQHSQ